jgi:hypothetical protein
VLPPQHRDKEPNTVLVGWTRNRTGTVRRGLIPERPIHPERHSNRGSALLRERDSGRGRHLLPLARAEGP